MSTYNKYKKAYKLLKELWWLKLSKETWDNINCELADEINSLYE